MQKLEPIALVAVLFLLGAGLWLQGPWALLSLGVVILALLVMLAGLESKTLSLHQVLPCVCLAALAALGRILLAPFPDIKPVSAIVIVAGAALGARSGFLCGALAALVSNLFFGQGAWTPWQMYAWGLMGYGAGLLAQKGLLKTRFQAAVYGFVGSLGFGLLMDAYTLVGFVRPITLGTAVATWGASLGFDVVHGLSTVAFLLVIWKSWTRLLSRFSARSTP